MRARAAALAAAAACGLSGCATGTTNGFAIDVPSGWQDRTSEAELKAGRKEFELVLEGPTQRELAPTLTVSRVKVRDGDTLDDVVRVQRKDARGANPTAPTSRTLAGEPARAYDFAAEGRRGRTVVALHAGRVYALSLVADAPEFDRAAPVLEEVSRSWRWEGG